MTPSQKTSRSSDLGLPDIRFGDPSAFGEPGWLEGLTQLCRCIGTPAFESCLLKLLNKVTPVDHCVVFTFGERGTGHLFTHGRMRVEEAQQLADDYVRNFHEQDPNFSQLSGATKGREDCLIPLAADADVDAAYQNHFFDRHDLIDKASTIGKLEQGSVYCNFYRMGRSGPYSDKDWQLLESILPLITTLISTHYRFLQLSPADKQEQYRNARSLVHNIISKNVSPFSQLTPREREVCERILLGYTSVGIGLDLNIAQSSVVTYRRRAYEKLDISTQNELFTLCLTASQYIDQQRQSS
ncbi:MAG: LuxR C-terminal-related transcriptional regulator [Gammaproteobacteria bacterium]|nr:MAG: LuxR C-terminal-related transcriptional regulator [Gammaproteobacteria bacterium]